MAGRNLDLIHCHWAVDETLAFLRDLPSSCPPVIVSFHTFEPVCPLKTHVTPAGKLCDQVPGTVCLRQGCRSPRKWMLHDVPLRRLRAVSKSRAALYLAHNRELVALVRRAGYDPVQELLLGIAREPGAQAPHPRPPVLLFAGRLRPEKGVALLVASLEEVFRTVPDAEIRIAGDGPEAEPLKQAAARFGTRVRFLGPLPPAELDLEFARARAVVMPSLWKENFGLVGVEAMAFGTPVLAPPVAGIRDWLRPGVNGLAIERDSVASLTAQAIGILRDPGLAAGLAPGALATAEEFSMDNHARALSQIYRETLGRERPGR